MKHEYPKDFENREHVYGYGGIRIYSISNEEATEIAKEFPAVFSSNPPFSHTNPSDPLYYMNVRHGEQHFIFSIKK